MEGSAAGMRALWISLGVLAVTAAMQAMVVALSGSVALFGDSLHNRPPRRPGLSSERPLEN